MVAAAPVGEYDRVLCMSADREALERAHRTEISPSDARALIALVFERYPLQHALTASVPAIRFAGYRGRSRLSILRPLITLPAAGNRVARSFSGVGLGSLRVGIVLHECAHHLAPLGQGGKHGILFTLTLDNLIAEFAEVAS